ncbi:hypothetical protein FACS189459_4800 [Bacilli bacterium]|nr:hypothetical protein FACS189459_4800 [Bacilli bacterium]
MMYVQIDVLVFGNEQLTVVVYDNQFAKFCEIVSEAFARADASKVPIYQLLSLEVLSSV